MTDDELRAAAEPPEEKLPHARYYLRATRWGFEAMVKNR
jgi:hypothetical protein